MKARLTQEQKDAMQAKSKAVREGLGRDSTVAVIDSFRDEWRRLEKMSVGLITECGTVVSDMAALMFVGDDGEVPEKFGDNEKSMLVAAIRACIGKEGTLMQYARKWAAIALVQLSGEPIKVEDKDGNITEYATITKLHELSIVSKRANEMLGIKPRGIRKAAAASPARQVSEPELWPLLEQVLQSEAGRATARRFLNGWGFELVQLTAAKVANRKLRKVA